MRSKTIPLATLYAIAANVPCDPRTVAKALDYGISSLHARHIKEQLRCAFAEHGIEDMSVKETVNAS